MNIKRNARTIYSLILFRGLDECVSQMTRRCKDLVHYACLSFLTTLSLAFIVFMLHLLLQGIDSFMDGNCFDRRLENVSSVCGNGTDANGTQC